MPGLADDIIRELRLELVVKMQECGESAGFEIDAKARVLVKCLCTLFVAGINVD